MIYGCVEMYGLKVWIESYITASQVGTLCSVLLEYGDIWFFLSAYKAIIVALLLQFED